MNSCLLPCSAALLCVQVELGGWLGERSWLRPFADALGWVDAYVERMLMAVILVKDEVSGRCKTAAQATLWRQASAVHHEVPHTEQAPFHAHATLSVT